MPDFIPPEVEQAFSAFPKLLDEIQSKAGKEHEQLIQDIRVAMANLDEGKLKEVQDKLTKLQNEQGNTPNP